MAKNLAVVIRESFYFLSLLLIICIGLEIIWPNIILAYFNLNYLFAACLLAGAVNLIKK